jgi:hypothetical protein
VVSFQIGNFDSLIGSSNSVFSERGRRLRLGIAVLLWAQRLYGVRGEGVQPGQRSLLGLLN